MRDVDKPRDLEVVVDEEEESVGSSEAAEGEPLPSGETKIEKGRFS